ncbi:MAG: aldo/keto reductase [Pseudomonadota bacterium]
MSAEGFSRLGFGVSGAHGTPLVRRRDTIVLIHDAFEQGVRVFDTAPAYGAGEAEARLGLALRDLSRDAVFISTKAGLFSSGLVRRSRDFSPDAIEQSVLASLARLGVEGVDALFLHSAAGEELTPALLDRLEALRRAGAFAMLGAAGRGSELDDALDAECFKAMMAPVHPFLSQAEVERIARARAAGLDVFAIETAGPGAPGLHIPRRPADLYKLAQGVRARADGHAQGHARLVAGTGLQAALENAQVSCALFTTTRLAHLQANAALLS